MTAFPSPAGGPVVVTQLGPGWRAAARAAGWRVRHAPLPEVPWRHAGTLLVVLGGWRAEEVVLALARGAGVAVAGPGPTGGREDDRWAAVLEDLDRLGGTVWAASSSRAGPPTDPPAYAPAADVDGTTASLLDALARGRFVAQAAREAHVSLRTAHRRLRDARQALGAATTVEAVTRWARLTPLPGRGDEDDLTTRPPAAWAGATAPA
jgi:hypothetical protein